MPTTTVTRGDTTMPSSRRNRRQTRDQQVATTITKANKRRLEALAERERRTVAFLINELIEARLDAAGIEDPGDPESS